MDILNNILNNWQAYLGAISAVLVAAIVGSMVLAHAVLEASARFHDPTVPILSMVAGAGLARLVDARRSRVT